MMIAAAVLISIIPPTYMQLANHRFVIPSNNLGIYDEIPSEYSYRKFKLSLERKNFFNLEMTLSNPLDTPVSYDYSSLTVFWFEAKQKGRWKPIEYIPYSLSLRCGTGAQYSLFPAHARTSTTYTLIPGTFETEIRFCTTGLDSSQCSNSIPASIDHRMFNFSQKLSSLKLLPYPGGVPFAINSEDYRRLVDLKYEQTLSILNQNQ